MNNDNSISQLRRMLFDQMERLSNPENNLEKEILRGEALVNVGKVIVDSAKAETDAMRLTGGLGTGFIPVGLPVNSLKQLGDGSDK